MQRTFTIEFFEQQEMHPVSDFLERLDPGKKARTMHRLELLGAQGKTLPAPHSRKSRNGIWDLKCSAGNSHWHLLYYYPEKGGTIVVVHAFAKKTESVPENEIRTAIERKEYFEAHT